MPIIKNINRFFSRQSCHLRTLLLCFWLGAIVMNDFKGRHFRGEVILWAVRWYWKRPGFSRSWRVDEIYIKVKGRWTYLYRAVDKDGDTIDFYLSPTRNAKAARRFLGKAVNSLKDWEKPETINTDKAPTYGIAIGELKKDCKLPDTVQHRQVKYLNNVFETDHGKLKPLIRTVRGFKTLKTPYVTIKGFEVMRALKKGQAKFFQFQDGIMGEVSLIERQFGIHTF